MSDGSNAKRVEFILSAKNEASGVVRRARKEIEDEMKAMGRSRGSIPLAGQGGRVAMAFPKPDRSAQEQEIRDQMAGRIRAMRETARREQVGSEVKRRLYGDAAPGGPSAEEGERAFGRSGSTWRGAASRGRDAGESVTKGWYKQLKEQTDGLEKMGKVIRGVGALAVVGEIGRAMQGLPEAQRKYHENIASGMTKTEAFSDALANALPIVGDLARGFQGLWQFITTGAAEAKAQRNKEEQKEKGESRAKIQEEKERNRAPVRAQTEQALREAGRRRGMIGLEGAAKERAEARNTLDDQNRAADQLAGSAGMFGSTEEQDKVKNAAKQLRIAAQEEFNRKMQEIDQKGNQDAIDARKEFETQMKGLDEETQIGRLERMGKGAEARAARRKLEYDKELAEINKREGEALKGAGGVGWREDVIRNGAAHARGALDRSRGERESAAGAEDQQEKNDAQMERRRKAVGWARDRAGEIGGRADIARRNRIEEQDGWRGDSQLMTGVRSKDLQDPSVDALMAMDKKAEDDLKLQEKQLETAEAMKTVLEELAATFTPIAAGVF